MTFPSFLPPNATQFELDLEGSMAQWLDTELLSTIWSPDNCPSDFIPWLAWALSIDVWDVEWLEERKREMLRRSIEIHKHKGTRWAIKELLTLVGVPEFELLEWFELNPQGVPHTFFIEILSTPGFDPYILDYEQYQRIKKLIETVKPERSQFALSIRTDFGNTEPPIYDPDTGIISGTGLVFGNVFTTSVRKNIAASAQGKVFLPLNDTVLMGSAFNHFPSHKEKALIGQHDILANNTSVLGDSYTTTISRYTVIQSLPNIYISQDLTQEITPTLQFERNSSSSVLDFEGVEHIESISFPRFYNARRIENILLSPEDFSASPWTATTWPVENTTPPVGLDYAQKVTQPINGQKSQGLTINNSTFIYSIYYRNPNYNGATPRGFFAFVVRNDTTGVAIFAVRLDENNFMPFPDLETYPVYWGVSEPDKYGWKRICFIVFGGFNAGDNLRVYAGFPGKLTEEGGPSIEMSSAMVELVDNQSVKQVGEFFKTHGYVDKPNGYFINCVHELIKRYQHEIASPSPSGLLLELERTNVIIFNEELDDTNWTLNNIIVTQSAELWLDGYKTVYKLISVSASGVHFIRQIITTIDDSDYCCSIYVKRDPTSTINKGMLFFKLKNNGDCIIHFDLETESIFSISGDVLSYGIRLVNNGWYIVWIAANVSNGAINTFISFNVYGLIGESSPGNDTDGFYAYRPQVEEGLYPTSSIPTGLSTVTRLKDVLYRDLGVGNFPQQFYLRFELMPFASGTLQDNIQLFITDDNRGSGYQVTTQKDSDWGFVFDISNIVFLLKVDVFQQNVTIQLEFILIQQGADIRAILMYNNTVVVNYTSAGLLDHSNLGVIWFFPAFSGVIKNVLLV